MKMKKIIATITALLLLLVSSSCTEEETAVSRRGSEISADKFKAEFTQYSGEGENKTAKLVYPDNFSGIYIGEDNRLYILYTHDKESLMNNISEDDTVFKQVEYGYNYLERVRAFAAYYSGCTCAIDEKENRVLVHIAKEKREALTERLCQTLDGFDENAVSFREPVTAVTT